MLNLGVNIDHVATVRQARAAQVPNILAAAVAAQKGGANGITVHLREDRRHIQDSDVIYLKKKIVMKLNLEMACSTEIVQFACRVRPADVCLVPEKRKELTTEGGLDVCKHINRISAVTAQLKKMGIRVSHFIDPVAEQVKSAKAAGADCVELHTGSYALAYGKGRYVKALRDLTQSAELAQYLGMKVNAGHGLDYQNLKEIVKITGLQELNIGFSIVARAIFVGLEQAVHEMKSVINNCAR